MELPQLILRLQHPVGTHRTLSGMPPYSQLHSQHRQPHNQQEQEIKQHKNAAAILSCHIRKPPYIAYADGTTGTNQNKPDTGIKGLTRHLKLSSYIKTFTNQYCNIKQTSMQMKFVLCIQKESTRQIPGMAGRAAMLSIHASGLSSTSTQS